MKLQISYQYPFNEWSVFNVFNDFFTELKTKYTNHDFTYIDSGYKYDGNPCSYYSPHIMVIKNIENNKYIIISYWDRAQEFSYVLHGWDENKRTQLITSSGVHSDDIKFTPFSYLCYSKVFEKFSKQSMPIENKPNNNLFFRGYLYGQRYNLSLTNMINITNNKIFPEEKYFEELNNNKICLSFNGAGEICNRDIEILSARSVLLRPKLHQKFHNDLVPDYHYISFEVCSDAKQQCQIIIDKFNSIKNNIDLLKYISDNGYEWYNNNGTISANIRILCDITNIEGLE